MSDGGGVCAGHEERGSVSTCSRCGRFCCEACARVSPCLECQIIQRDASRPLSPGFDWAVGLSAFGYAVCTVLMVPAMAAIDWAHLTKKDLASGPMLALAVINTIYSVVWTALAASWLVWFLTLMDWAKARVAELPGKGAAFAFWFVPFVNAVHPFMTMRKIQRGTGVQTPLAWWWGMTWVSLILATVAMTRLREGGYDPIFVVASALEVGAVLLCWKIVGDFRAADRKWDPRAEIALRG